jgi:hypothetical protein
MAAGLGFKTFTTGEVLTAGDVNGYLMQGVLVFASAAARNAAITSPQEGQFAFTKDTNGLWYYDGAVWVASGATGDIEGVTAGTGISGGGTSGTVTITNSMATAIDAKGDLIVGTGADTFSRLAVGATNGHVLQVDSAEATGLKWAAVSAGGGGMTLLSTTTLSGTATVISSIDQSYKNLEIIIFGFTANTNSPLRIAPNGDFGITRGQNTATYTTVASGTNEGLRLTGNDISTNNSSTNAFSTTIFNYASTTAYKPYRTSGTFTNSSSSDFGTFGSGGIATTSAITSITINCASNTFSNGTVLLYGVK